MSVALPPYPATLNSSQPLQGLQNLTVGLPKPPLPFDVKIQIGGPKLRTTDCLLNVIEALKHLALGDFQAKIVDGTEYRLSAYPRVSIIVNTPRRKRNVLACYVMWALVLGVEEMIDNNKFELAQAQLKWNDELLGWVHFVDNPPSLTGLESGNNANETVDTAKRSIVELLSSNSTIDLYSPNVTNIISTDTTNDPTEARLTTSFKPLPGNLGIYDVFFPIINAIADMADRPSDHQTQGLIGGFEGYKGIVCIILVPHEGPPFLTYGWIIRAISRIPMWMVQQGRFGETEILMAVDGVEVGFGRVTVKPCE